MLSAVVAVLIPLTITFGDVGLRNNLNRNEEELKLSINNQEAPSNVRQEVYYSSNRVRSDSSWYVNLDERNISPEFIENQYYFHEGDMQTNPSYTNGDILDRDDSYAAPPPVELVRR